MMDLKFGTICGVQFGFEFITKEDFASIDFPANWSLLVNLFIVRLTLTSFKED